MVDMPRDDTINFVFFGGIHQCCLEVADVHHGLFHAGFEHIGERPVGEAQFVSDPMGEGIDSEQPIIQPTAYHGDSSGVFDHYIKLITMDNQKSFAILGFMDALIVNLQIAESYANEVAQQFVMVATDIANTGAMLGFSQYRLDDIVVGLRPIELFLHLPQINDIAH